MTDLPPGWEYIPLRDIGVWYGGGTPSKARADFWENGTVPWLSPKDMGADVISGTQDHITRAAVENSTTRLVPAGSVAVVVRSGILERKLPVGLVPFETTLNQDMKAIVPFDGVDPRWISWGLRFLEQHILRNCRKAGTTVASIETSRLLELEFPVPPVTEQDRIFTALEEHLSRLDAGFRGVKANLIRIENWKSSLLATVVSGKLIEQRSSWGVASIGDMAKVGTGATPLRSQKDYYEGGNIPWITSSLVNRPFIDEADQFVTSAALEETSVKLWPVGTLLVAMYGEGKTRGKCSELRIPATTNQACAAIIFDKEHEWRRPWVKLVLQATYEKNRKLASGGVQPNLNLSLVRGIRIPLPSRSEQDAILVEVDRQLTLGESLSTELTGVRRRVDVLRRSLLKEAFVGRLVPQDPEDEPASVLLERIKAERVTVPAPKRRARHTGSKAAESMNESHTRQEAGTRPIIDIPASSAMASKGAPVQETLL